MSALHINVLVRYLVQDDSSRFAQAKRLIDGCMDAALSLFVPVMVLLELGLVLRSRFGFAKVDIRRALSSLFSVQELTLECERALEVALKLFRDSTLDFADCLHVGLTAQVGKQLLWTFDKRAA